MSRNDVIEDKTFGLIVRVKQPNTEESSRIFCDKIEYMHDRRKDMFFDCGKRKLVRKKGCIFFDHHLMFYNKGKLVFKVWLKNELKDPEYKNIQSALKAVGIQATHLELN